MTTEEGGDIDLLVKTTQVIGSPAKAIAQIQAALIMRLGDQKYDVLLMAPNLEEYEIHLIANQNGVVLWMEHELQKRLEFLTRIALKEIDLVEYAMAEAFDESFTLAKAKNLESLPELALKLEAFSSRFCRLQDTVEDKLLPALLSALGEKKSPFLTNLNKAEQYQWLDSAEYWVELRQLRNQMVHEYIEDAQQFYSAISEAKKGFITLRAFAQALILETRKILENDNS